MSTAPVVTAIVSTYAAAKYMRGCLDDLLQQTLGDRLEILVIDACSPEDEGAIVREYMQRHANIRYLRTPTRENTSQAFNRAIDLARGRYLTTANTDDRHRPDFCERMAAVLDAHAEFGLVYADSLITTRANETWADNTARHRYALPDFTLPTALTCCLFGSQAMWRRAAHDLAGRWDPTLIHANDQDMFVRIAWRCGAVHLRETLGLFLQRPDSESGAHNRLATLADIQRVLREYRTGIPLEDLFPRLRTVAPADAASARAAALFELGNLCALGPYTDAQLALDCWQQATALPLAPAAATAVRRAFANNSACVLACAGADDAANRAFALAGGDATALANQRSLQTARARGERPLLATLRMHEIAHAVVADARRTRGIELSSDGSHAWSAHREQLPWDVYVGPNGVPVEPGERTWSLPATPPRPRLDAAARHVLLVAYGWQDSGGGTLLPREVAKALAARGDRVTVFYASAAVDADLPPYSLRRAHDAGVDTIALCNRRTRFADPFAPTAEIDDPAASAVFDGVLAETRPDVVHFFNLHGLSLALPARCKARGIPTVFSSQNHWAICPRLYLADERLQRCSGGSVDGSKCAACLGHRAPAADYAARRSRAIDVLEGVVDVHLASSPRIRELFAQNGFDAARIRVVQQQSPASDEIWRRTGSARSVLRQLERPLRVGFLGSILPHKGVHVLVQALQTLPRGLVHCVALGDEQGDYLSQLKQLDARRAVHWGGAFAPAVLPGLLGALDVVVVPSLVEEIGPMVVGEALAARVPVLGSRIGGIPDFVEHGRNGLLFAPGDAAGLAQCLLAFSRDPELLGRLQAGITPPRGFAAYVDELRAVYAEVGAAPVELAV